MQVDRNKLTTFLQTVGKLRSSCDGEVEIEAGFGVFAGFDRDHSAVPYEDFYRCYAAASRSSHVSGPVLIADDVYAGGVLRRSIIGGETVFMKKVGVAEPIVFEVAGLWRFCGLKLRAKHEKILPTLPDTRRFLFTRRKKRMSVVFPNTPLWRVDFTQVVMLEMSRHEIEVELDYATILKQKGVSLAVILDQFEAVVARLVQCFARV